MGRAFGGEKTGASVEYSKNSSPVQIPPEGGYGVGGIERIDQMTRTEIGSRGADDRVYSTRQSRYGFEF